MVRPTQIEVKESVEEIQSRLRRTTSGGSQARLLCLYWLKTGAAKTRRELVERSGRSPATITRWLSKYRRGGIKELLHLGQAPGRQSLVNGRALAKLQERLKQPEGFNSYKEIQSWLEAEWCG
jgi:transposase